MKYAIAALVLIPLSIFVYHKRSTNLRFNSAFATYQTFAAAYHRDRITECRSLSDGASMKTLIDAREKRHLDLARVGATDAATNTVVSTDYEKTSQAAVGENVQLVAVMTIRQTPAGMVSARNIPQTKYRHTVTLRPDGAAWKLVAFEEAEIK